MLVPGLLTADYDVSTFCSGEASLDRWLRDHALAAQQRGHSRVLGGMVLAEALGRVAHVADQVGVRFLVVDRPESARRNVLRALRLPAGARPGVDAAAPAHQS